MTTSNLAPYEATSQNTFPNLTDANLDWVLGPKTTGIVRCLADIPLWEVEKPFCLTLPLPQGQPKSNIVTRSCQIEVCNARGREQEFCLDTHGFSFAELPAISIDMDNKLAVETDYVAQMERWLKERLDASSVHIFDYTLRKRKPRGEVYGWTEKRPPAMNAHIDQTPPAALARLKLHFGDNVDQLIKGRVQLINIWRPTAGPVEEFPLVVCDGRTVQASDLVPQDLVYPHYIGENYQLKIKQSHRWYYLSHMQTNEGILIKNFDSRTDGTTRLCPHAAFNDHNTPPNARLRESVEVRALVFHE